MLAGLPRHILIASRYKSFRRPSEQRLIPLWQLIPFFEIDETVEHRAAFPPRRREGGAMLHSFIDLEKWNQLPKGYQALLRTACEMTYTWMQSKYDAANPTALKRLIAGGAKLHPFSPTIGARQVVEVYKETSEKNNEFKKVYDSMVAFRGDQYLWWQVAEYSFDTYQIRARPGLDLKS